MLAAWRQLQLQVEWLTLFRGKGKSFAGPTVSRVKVTDISIQFCQVVHWSTKGTRKLEGDLQRYGALDHSSKRDSPCHTLLSWESRPSVYVSCNCWLVSFKSHTWDALRLRQTHTLKVCFPTGSSKVWLGSHAGHVLMSASDRNRKKVPILLCWRGTTWRLSTTLIIFDLWTTNGENAKLESTKCLIQIRPV